MTDVYSETHFTLNWPPEVCDWALRFKAALDQALDRRRPGLPRCLAAPALHRPAVEHRPQHHPDRHHRRIRPPGANAPNDTRGWRDPQLSRLDP